MSGCGCDENKQLSGLKGTGTGIAVFIGIAAVLTIAYVALKATDKKKAKSK